MSNRNAFNTDDGNIKVTIYGDEPSVPLHVDSSGAVNVVGNIMVESMEGIEVTGDVSLTSNQVVSLQEDSVMIMGGHSTIQVEQTINISSLVALTHDYYSTAIDVSEMSSFSYYIKVEIESNLLSLFSKLDIYSQVCPTTVTGDFVNSPSDSVTITQTLLEQSKPGILANTPSYMKYARLYLKLTALSVLLAGQIHVVFVGRY